VEDKLIVIIAGPNGAGKTTFAQQYLPGKLGIRRFINADLIAAGLSPLAPEREAIRAGKMMLIEIASCVSNGEAFGFETTLSARMYARLIPEWKAAGYLIQLVFLSLPSADMAVARVKARVMGGGHDIPVPTIRRRFEAGLRNFETLYKALADEWFLYDNSEIAPELIDSGDNT